MNECQNEALAPCPFKGPIRRGPWAVSDLPDGRNRSTTPVKGCLDRPPAVKALAACLLVLGLIWPLSAAAAAIRGNGLIVDQAGRTIQTDAPFRHIISLYGAHTENLCALGLSGRLIGVSPSETYPPRAREKPVFSYHDGPERFLAADPDLILLRPMIDRGYAKLVTRLESAGITVVSLQPRTVEEMITYWRILGRLTGRQDEARSMVEAFRGGVDFARSLTSGLEDPEQVYFEAIHEQMKTFAQDSPAMFVLRTAGGKNVATDATSVRGTNIAAYGKERILAKAESIDVYLAQKGPMNQPTVEKIVNEPGFGLIKAVQEGRICIVDEQTVSRPTVRLLLGIHSVGGCLYPDIFDHEAADRFRSIVNRVYNPE